MLKLAVLLLATCPLMPTSMVTSVEKLRDLAAGSDVSIGAAVEEAVQAELAKVQELTRLLVELTRTEVPSTKEVNLNHPNDLYLLIKRHVTSLTSRLRNHNVLNAFLKNYTVRLPTKTDLTEAMTSLIRLQRVYGLDVHDMFRGNYSGYQGSALDTDDAFLLGKAAFQHGYPLQAEEWLQLTVDKLTDAPEDTSGHANTWKRRRIEALSLLGRTYYYDNKTDLAEEVFVKCKAAAVSGISDVITLEKELEATDHGSLQAKYKRSYKSTDANVSILCSRDKDERVAVTRPFHVCRLKPDVFTPYLRYKEEILSTSPYVSLFYDVIHDEEIEHLKEKVRQKLKRGQVIISGRQHAESKHRTGELSWVDDTDKVAAGLSQRVKAMTRLEVSRGVNGQLQSSEAFQVVNYGLGGHYDVHMDVFAPKYVAENNPISGNRLATFLFYLSDVEKGGSTIFLRAGISVAPIKGMALFWYNYAPSVRSPDLMTLHAGCPVVIGNKWIANKWLLMSGNTFRRPCGLDPDSTQLDVETVVTPSQLTT